MSQLPRLAPIAVLLLTACASTPEHGDTLSYQDGVSPSVSSKPLEIPPDLTLPETRNNYDIPLGSISASSSSKTAAAPAQPTLLPAMKNARLRQAGNQRWLEIDAEPEKLWPELRAFWKELGFQLEQDAMELGILETDWRENHAKLPLGGLRGVLANSLGQVYSTGEMDKFRTRIERNGKGGSEVFISSRGMQEVYADRSKEQTVWQPRQPNPELEAEVLKRLLIKLGVSEQDAVTKVATPVVSQRARLQGDAAQRQLQLDDSFDRGWRRVGQALDQIGYPVTDRDRSKGLFYIREASEQKKDGPGFFSKLAFWKEARSAAPLEQWQVQLTASGEQTLIQIKDRQGKNVAADSAGYAVLDKLETALK